MRHQSLPFPLTPLWSKVVDVCEQGALISFLVGMLPEKQDVLSFLSANRVQANSYTDTEG